MINSNSEALLRGYESGFNSGAKEGNSDAYKGEAYSPSLKKVWNGGYRRSIGYWRGFEEGYDYGWKMARKGFRGTEEEATWYIVALSDADVYVYSHGETEETSGYATGYNTGRKQALADSKEGRDYNENPSDSIIDSHCKGKSQQYRSGWIAGYKFGYRENYNADGYKSGYDAGKKQAMADSEAGRDYRETPSETTIDSYCKDKSQEYKEGWIAGYKDGYRENWSAAKGSEYQAGFEQGYKKGLETGRLDKRAGYTYNDTPHGYYEGAGGEDYQEGFKNGYKKGYKEGYSEGDWEWDPSD